MIGQDIQWAVEVLSQGGLVAIPTETVYGLAARISDDDAILKVFKAKDRPSFDPLIVHLPKQDDVSQYVIDFPAEAKKLAEAFWPGPLTLLLRKSDKVSDLITSGHDTVALRVPQHPLTLSLLNLLGEPVAAPSANPFGYVSPTSAQHVVDQLGERVDYILDGGPSQVGIESTIVSCIGQDPVVLRLGGLKLEDLEDVVGRPIELNVATHSNPKAPGQLDKHYATRTPLVLTDDIEAAFDQHINQRLGLLTFDTTYDALAFTQRKLLSKQSNLDEAAQNLFKFMRELDEMQLDVIIAETLPNKGLGRAMNDRLRRAAQLSEKK